MTASFSQYLDLFLAVAFRLTESHFESRSKAFRGHCAHRGGGIGGRQVFSDPGPEQFVEIAN